MSRPAVKGFTLIEVLVALAVFVAGVAGVLALFSSGLALHRDGLSVARGVRNLDGIVHRIRQEVSAGLHWNADRQAWKEVVEGSMPDGTVYQVRFVPEETGMSVLAIIRTADGARRLAGARPVSFVLRTGPTHAEAVRRYRARPRD